MDQEPRDLIDHVLRSWPTLERSAWYLKVRPADERDSRHCTKFGGNKPFRANNFKWPVCGECRSHKAFVCQINIANLPHLLKEHIKMTSGLFQFFYCYECLPICCFEDIYIIQSSELLPSLKSLASEKVDGLKGYKKVLPSILRNFVEEFNKNIPPKVRNEELVVEGYNIVSEMPTSPEISGDSELAHEIKRKANFTEEQYQSFLDQLFVRQAKYHVDYEGVKLGGWISFCPEQEAYLDCPDCGVRMDITFLQFEDVDDELYQFYWGSENSWGQVNVMICPQCKRPGLKRL